MAPRIPTDTFSLYFVVIFDDVKELDTGKGKMAKIQQVHEGL